MVSCFGFLACQSPSSEIDRETLRQDLQQALTRQAIVEERADGTDILDLRGGFQHAVLLRENDDGSVSVDCVDTMEKAERFLLNDDPDDPHAHSHSH